MGRHRNLVRFGLAAALTAAQGDPAAIEQVVTDMNNMAAQLTAADPTPPAPPATPPAGG